MKQVDFKVIDLTQPLSVMTPPWPTYEPLQPKFFKRQAPNGASGQLITTSNHVGTHLDGPVHFCTHGSDIASLELNGYLCGPGAVVDLSDIAEPSFWMSTVPRIRITSQGPPQPILSGPAMPG